jgi:hypothetical protein
MAAELVLWQTPTCLQTGAWGQATMDGITRLLDEASAGFADIDRLD